MLCLALAGVSGERATPQTQSVGGVIPSLLRREEGRKSAEAKRVWGAKRPWSRWPGCGGDSLGQRSVLLPGRI